MFHATLLAAALAAAPTPQDLAALKSAPVSVLFDRASDGTLWALGSNWKMRFDAAGATYFPLFGERAQHHTPLAFRLALPITAQAVRAGNRVSIERGGLVEVYDLAPDHVEQSFVLAARPAPGDFSLRLDVATDLPATRGDHGIAFDAGDLGHVEYGDATIVDAAGRTLSQRSEWDGTGVRFTLQEAFLAEARFPVVIDPLLTTLNVDASGLACTDPSVAYEDDNDMFLVTFVRAANGVDHDIIARRYAPNTVFQAESAVEISTEESREPSVAASLTTFLVVWTDKDNPGTGDDIRARRVGSFDSSLGTAFTVANTNIDEHAPDVGGTRNGGTTPFLVVWQQDTFGNSNVAGRTCSSTAVGSAITDYTVSRPTTIESQAHVANSVNTTADPWLVVWAVGPNAAGVDDVECVAVGSNGAAIGSIVSVSGTTSLHDRAPDVASDESTGGSGIRRYLVVWEQVAANGDSNVFGRTIRHASGVTSTVSTAIDLSNIELGAAASNADQSDPALGFDGVRWTYAYRENTNVFCATVHVDTTVTSFEKHVTISNAAGDEQNLAIGSSGGFLAGNHLIAWNTDAVTANVDAAMYSSLNPGGVTVVDNGCGAANEPFLAPLPPGSPVGDTVAIPGQTLGFQISGLHAPILVIGPAANLPLCPNQGGCVLGVSPQLVVPFTPSLPFIAFTVPADPSLIGFAISLQIIDAIPAGSANPKCGPPKHGAEFRTSDTMSIIFQ